MTGFGRIRLPGEAKPGDACTLGGEDLKTLLLWRPRIGEAVTVTDAAARLFRARLTGLGEDRAELLVYEEMGAVEPQLNITLIQALPEKERMELIIQKAAELGASAIIPCESARSITLTQRDSGQKKSHKWLDVALRAARQSRSPFITGVLPYRPFNEALDAAKGADLKIALWERPGIARIKDILKEARQRGTRTVAMAAGPEGGFTDEEMDEASKLGFVPVSLGERILRTETAAIAAVAIIRYELTE